MDRTYQLIQYQQGSPVDMTDEVPACPALLEALEDIVTDDNPIIIRDPAPQIVVIDWHQYEDLIERLGYMGKLLEELGGDDGPA